MDSRLRFGLAVSVLVSGLAYGQGLVNPLQQGALECTKNVLDFALAGRGYFALGDPAKPQFTRNGVFEIDAQGQLISHASQLPVLVWNEGQPKPLIFQPGCTGISVKEDGTVSCVPAGEKYAKVLGWVAVAVFRTPSALKFGRGGAVTATTRSGPGVLGRAGEGSRATVIAGYRELL